MAQLANNGRVIKIKYFSINICAAKLCICSTGEKDYPFLGPLSTRLVAKSPGHVSSDLHALRPHPTGQ